MKNPTLEKKTKAKLEIEWVTVFFIPKIQCLKNGHLVSKNTVDVCLICIFPIQWSLILCEDVILIKKRLFLGLPG